MNTETHANVAQALEASKEDLTEALANVSEQDASRKPAKGGWSVLECAEHIVAVEERFLGRLQQAERLETPRVDQENETKIVTGARNRATRAEAPEPVRPAGRFQSLSAAQEAFHAVRNRTLQFADEHREHLYHLTLDHPRFGTLNGTEVLLLMAAHAQRHADQIREVKTLMQTTSTH